MKIFKKIKLEKSEISLFLGYMFFLNFFLTFKLIVDKNNYKIINEKSFQIPVFILIYSPHCPHCRSIHPTWEDLMKKYEKDKKVMIADCNDIDYRKECDSIYKTDSFPTFVILTRGKAKRIRPERTLQSFVNETEKLKKIDYSTNCSSFQAEFSYQYPAFILSNNKNNAEKCSQLQKIMKAFPKSSQYLYINSTHSEEESFVGMLSANITGKYEGPKEMDSLISFIKEYMMTPFGEWNYSEASLYNKRIGFLIHYTHSEFMSFSKIIEPFYNDFTLCKMDADKFSKLVPEVKLTKSELPTFAISNKEKTKFYLIKNVVRDANCLSFIKNGTSGGLDSLADIDLSQIFPIIKQNPKKPKIQNNADKDQGQIQDFDKNVNQNKDYQEKIIKATRTSFPSKLASTSFKVFVVVFFIFGATAITGILCYINNSGNKIE